MVIEGSVRARSHRQCPDALAGSLECPGGGAAMVSYPAEKAGKFKTRLSRGDGNPIAGQRTFS